jgi:hypothetical protein
MTSDFTIELNVQDQRVRYVEAKRIAAVRLESDHAGDWWLWPDTLNWWERREADDLSAGGRAGGPVSDAEREMILARLVNQLREKHRLWVNIAGRAVDPRPADWKAPPVRTDLDPELAFIMDGTMLENQRIEATPEMDAVLLADIDRALVQVQPMADAGWEQAQSIARQLRWCGAKLRGERVEPPPGPFSMGLTATREFDMYGSQPELASLINAIQTAMQQRGFP